MPWFDLREGDEEKQMAKSVNIYNCIGTLELLIFSLEKLQMTGRKHSAREITLKNPTKI